MADSFGDVYFTRYCTKCYRKDRTTDATVYCPVCNIYLCNPCLAIHDEFTRSHDVKDTTKLDLWGVPKQPEVEHCHVHQGLAITTFCEQHEALCCAICSSERHSTCENKVSVEKLAERVYRTQDLASLLSSIGQLKPQLTALSESLGQRQVSLDDSKACLRATLQDYRDTVQSALKKQVQRASDDVEVLYSRRDGVLQADVDICDTLAANIKELHDTVSDTGSKSDDIQLLLNMKCAQDMVLTGKHSLKHMAQPDHLDIKWSKNETVLNRTKCALTLGHLSTPIEPGHLRHIQRVSNLHVYKIRHKHDKNTCDIQGICQLLDGTIILSDKTNTNLKRLDSAYNVAEVCDLEFTPGDLCRTGRKEVAVALYGQKMVQFISVTDKMRVTQALKFDLKCYKIAWREDILYIVNGWGHMYAYHITENKTKSKLMKMYSGDFVKYSLTLKADCEHIYIAGTSQDLTTIATRAPSSISHTAHPEMAKKSKKHICIDNNGNVLVSNYDTGSILLFNNHGLEANGKLVSNADDFKYVDVICVDVLNSKLIVQSRGCDTIKVTDIIYQ